MNIRTICEDDAEQFLTLCKQLDLETQFMLLEPGERKNTLEEQRTQIEILLRQENQTIFVAEQDKHLIGYLAASGGTFKRNRHSAYLVIGILPTRALRLIGLGGLDDTDNDFITWRQPIGAHPLQVDEVFDGAYAQ